MRLILFFFSLFVISSAVGQTNTSSSDSARFKSLVRSIVAKSSTDSLKALAIFKWVAINVAYDVEMYKSGGTYMSQIAKPPHNFPSISFDDWYNHEVAAYVLDTRKGICGGYSRLYKVMCDYAGLKCRVISGYAHDIDSIGLPIKASHAWNAVMFNNIWHLLDVTWGSGYLRSGKFSYAYDPYYFNTPPQWFIKDHYPEVESNTLLPFKTSVESFFSIPYVWSYFNKIGGVKFLPAKGRLAISKNDTLEFRVTFKGQALPVSLGVEPGGSIDLNTPGVYPNSLHEGVIANPSDGNEFSFRYYLSLKTPKILTIYAGGKSILTYSLVPK